MRWLPVLIGVSLCLLVGGIWFALDRQRDADAFRLVAARATELASFIAGDIRARVPSLQRIAHRWERHGGTAKDEFVQDAAAYVKDLPGF